jgi:hypothetical protein
MMALAACDARGPAATQALELSRPVALDQSRIIFYTPGDLRAWLVSDTNVFVNRRRVGRMLRNGMFWADVAPGRQVLSTSTETGLSTVISTRPGEVVFVELGDGLAAGIGFTTQTIEPRQVSEEEGRAAIAGMRTTGTNF